MEKWRFDEQAAFDEDFDRLRSRIHFDLNNRTLLLTGATGFFGLWLIELMDWLRRVERMEMTVYVLSRDPEDAIRNRPMYRDRKWLRFIRGDVRSFLPPDESIDYVIHGAADTSADAGANGLELLDVLGNGTRHVLDMARQLGRPRVLLVSSGAVYGASRIRDKFLETRLTAPDPLKPSSAYGEGKRMSEAIGACMANQSELDVVIARCFAFVGAGLPFDGHFAIGNFIRDAVDGRDILLRSTGESCRSYLYAADLAIWLVALLLTGKSGEAYNVGSDEEVSIISTAGLVRDCLNPALSIKIKESADAGVSFYVPDITKAQTELGLGVWTPLETAIRRTANDSRRFRLLRV